MKMLTCQGTNSVNIVMYEFAFFISCISLFFKFKFEVHTHTQTRFLTVIHKYYYLEIYQSRNKVNPRNSHKK